MTDDLAGSNEEDIPHRRDYWIQIDELWERLYYTRHDKNLVY